jgi:ankyrin repeat protein
VLTIWHGKEEIALALIAAKGADVNVVDRDGNTLLHLVESENIAKELVKKITNVNVQNRYGETPLLKAAREGNADVVKALIIGGADVNALNTEGDTPLDIAKNEAVKNLLEVYGGKSHSQVYVEWDGDLRSISALLAQGVDVNAIKTIHGLTPLLMAVWTDNLKVIEALLARGADVNAVNEYGKTPLDNARGEVKDLLRRNGAKTGDEIRYAQEAAARFPRRWYQFWKN